MGSWKEAFRQAAATMAKAKTGDGLCQAGSEQARACTKNYGWVVVPTEEHGGWNMVGNLGWA